MRELFFLASRDLRFMFSSRETLVWTFLMPIIFFYFIGTVTGGFAPSGARRDPLALLSGGQSGFLIDQLVRRLEEQEFRVLRDPAPGELESVERRLWLPAHFEQQISTLHAVRLPFLSHTSGLGAEYDQVRLKRALYTLLADIVAVRQSFGTLDTGSLETLNRMPRALTLKVHPAGRKKEIPTGFQQAVPGTMVMFTLMIMTVSGAMLLLAERLQGLLCRLASTPISRSQIVWGKWAGKLLLGLVQIAFAMLTGTLLFGVTWGPHLGAVLLVLVAYAGLAAALGMLLGTLARSRSQAVAVGVVSTNVLAALGGCWWPIEIAPPWMQRLQMVLPTGWAMDALHQLVSFESPAWAVLPHLAALLAATVILMAATVRLFRFQ